MKKIDFLICGAQKSGTTSVHHCLRQSPRIWMPKTKELHYFDTNDYINDIGYYNYHKYYSDAPSENVKLGEATPIYLYWKQCMIRIKQYSSKMKLVVSLRNPIERAYSAWRMERDRGVEKLDFLTAVQSERARIRGNPDFPTDAHRHFSYVDRGLYAKQLRNAYSLFSHDQILLVDFNEIRDDIGSACNNILRFLDIKEDLNLDAPIKLNSASTPSSVDSIPIAAKQLLLDFYQRDITDLESTFGFKCRHWLEE